MKTHPNITSLKQFFGGGVASSETCGCGTLGPGERSGSLSSPSPAPRRQSQDAPHLSLASSTGGANWQRLGSRARPLDSELFKGDAGARTGLGDARTGELFAFTGEYCSDPLPSVDPFNIVFEYTHTCLNVFFCSALNF